MHLNDENECEGEWKNSRWETGILYTWGKETEITRRFLSVTNLRTRQNINTQISVDVQEPWAHKSASSSRWNVRMTATVPPQASALSPFQVNFLKGNSTNVYLDILYMLTGIFPKPQSTPKCQKVVTQGLQLTISISNQSAIYFPN